jgi:hypothetical protein
MTRCNPSSNTLRSALIVALLIATSCGQQDSGSAPQRKASSEETVGRSIAPTAANSPAVRVVKEFFRNWEFKRYAAMHEQTVHSRDKEVFCRALRGTPIRWKNLLIEKESRVDADWWVSLSLDVTDLKSATAAALITARASMSLISGTNNYILPPSLLNIERWMTVRQKWHIVSVGNKHFIDIGAGDSKINRKDNILNYFLDAAHFDFPFIPSSMPEEDQKALLVSAWLAALAMDLGIGTEGIKKILVEAKPLVKEGNRNAYDLAKKFEEALASRNALVRPGRSATQTGTSLAREACELYKAHILVMRNRTSLAREAKAMSAGNRRELARRLEAMTFASATDRQRQHFVAARDSIVELLISPPSNEFDKKYKERESMQLLIPVLADARLTGAVASQCGFPEISKQVDALLKFAKGLLLITQVLQ